MSVVPTAHVSLKLTLYRARGIEKHRFSGEYDYSALCTAIAEVWGTVPKLLRVTYEDDEGDEITICTQREWEECVALQRSLGNSVSAPLKLTVRRGQKSKSGKAHRMETGRSGDEGERNSDEDTPRTDPATAEPAASNVLIPRLHLSKTRNHTTAASRVDVAHPLSMVMAPEPAPASQFPNIAPSPLPRETPTTFSSPSTTMSGSAYAERQPEAQPEQPTVEVTAPFVGDGTGIAALRLISLLYNCDAVRELTSPQSTAPFIGTIVHVNFNPNTFEAHIDVDQLALRQQVTRRCNLLMDCHRYDDAHDVLRAASDLFPTDVIILYNLACVNALMYEPERAMQNLRRAIAAGYSNAEKMEADEDLALLRADPEFKSLVARMRAVQGFPAVPASSVNPVSVSAPAAPQPASEVRSPVAPPQPASIPREDPAPVPVVVPEPAAPLPEPVPAPVPQPAAPLPEPVPVPAPQPAASANSSPSSSANMRGLPAEVRQLLSMFPMLDAEDATQFLIRTHNDVRRAVAIILGDV